MISGRIRKSEKKNKIKRHYTKLSLCRYLSPSNHFHHNERQLLYALNSTVWIKIWWSGSILEIYVFILILNQIAIFELDIYRQDIHKRLRISTLDSCIKYIMKYELYLISTIEFIISVSVAVVVFFPLLLLSIFFSSLFSFSFEKFSIWIYSIHSYCFWCCISCFIIDVLWYGLSSAFFLLFFCFCLVFFFASRFEIDRVFNDTVLINDWILLFR